ncbi:orotate phosphoribosyltransferase [Thermosediminibacter litoriperuensis]|uniref:Orotate phosphoribosyltransferase n=1 Tax=Thermosediminibacter litoriperuensis TaxID=291989 RepID=A0A5S5ANR0_9FIRM|nr:orotate phosphoribosyltransferase [Thermosediminibacter litoriperuensis]TYP52485.1 orotate phosphoribosyltransferase [Thermosediminibacter litoriperuensis]
MTQEQIRKLFTETGVLQTGHFILTSGRHSSKYLQCARLLQYPTAAEKACRELAQNFKDMEVQTVIGPALGGIIVSYEVARALDARALFAERENGRMVLRRGFALKPGERVLVVEDVVTTGGSVKEVSEFVKSCGAEVLAVGALVDRSGGKVDFGVPSRYLLNLEVESYLPEECPLCAQGIPAEKPGSRS